MASIPHQENEETIWGKRMHIKI